MSMKFKSFTSSLLLATASVLLLSGFTAPTEKSNNSSAGHVDTQGSTVAKVIVAQANSPASSENSAAGACMKSVSSMAKTGNSVIDTRCSLVAFEVCMNKATGIISQSQGAKKQCAIMQGLGGATACQQPCIDAVALPVGGNGVVDRYTGLTASALSCYNDRMDRLAGGDERATDCGINLALQCLMNGSSSASVNAAILRDRKSACKSFYGRYPGEVCVACYKDGLRVDYDPLKVDLIPSK